MATVTIRMFLAMAVLFLPPMGAVSTAPARAGAAPVECWRGWGYWVDARTRAYKSDEMLFVTRGAADWAPGVKVRLYRLDRASGRIDDVEPAIAVIPIVARTYYRGTTNYVNAMANVAGSDDQLVFGLSHVAPSVAALPRMARFNAWACGLGNGDD